MDTPLYNRGLSANRAFTLLELIIVFVLIGILSALLIPKLTQVKEEALRQTARQQVKVLEKALANWYASEPNFAQASKDWDSYDANKGTLTAGYITNTAAFLTDKLQPYLDGAQFLTATDANGMTYFCTNEMNQIRTPDGSTNGTQMTGSVHNAGTGIDAAISTSHIRLYWQPTVTTANPVIDRHNYSPKIHFFLPTPKTN